MHINIRAIYPATYLNIVSQIMKELNLHGLVDQLVPTDAQCQTRPSDVVQLIVLDILSGRQALMHLESWAAQIDIEKLVREGLTANQLNDDAIGRHLDRLHEAGVHEVVSSFLLRTYQVEKLPLRFFHGDTTSKSVYGAYESPADTLKITHGYSRDRVGAKQIQFGLIGNTDGIPLYADVHDGNTSDKEWNPAVLEKVHKQLEKAELTDGFVYVADSAAMTQNTLKQVKAAHAYLLTRAPNQLNIVKDALKLAEQPEMEWTASFQSTEKTGATYRCFETSAHYYGYDVRLIVVESSALDKRKEHTLAKRVAVEAEKIVQAQKQYEKMPYHCEADAKQALTACEKELSLRFHTLTTTITCSEQPKKKRGRPKKDAPIEMETIYQVVLQTTVNEEAVALERRRASRFVLATTLPTVWLDRTMDGPELLSLYKGQIHVEMNFAFLKDPYYTDEIYLKKPERVQVLGYLFLLALVIYRVFQRRIRQFITEEHPMKGSGGRKLTKPTSQVIFQLFQYVQVVVFELPDGTKHRQFGKPLTYDQQRVLKGLGMDESIYL